jgi:hypothetical protein
MMTFFMPQPLLLVTMRVADLHRTTSPVGSSFTECCHRCKERVVLSPSSRKWLAERKRETIVVCLQCSGGAPGPAVGAACN